MLEVLQRTMATWSSKPHPRLLMAVTLAAALVAGILLIGAVNDSAILYKEF